MKIAATLLVWLALASATLAADENVESVVSGTLTIQLVPTTAPGAEASASPQTGQVTVRLGSKKAAAQPDKLEQCGEQWNKRLAAHNKRLEQAKGQLSLRAQIKRPLTRFDYRREMYECLEGAGQDIPAAAQ